jgi:NAD(P)H-flavin reductase/ferredoxin
MLGVSSSTGTRRATINGRGIVVQAGETLLQAALRQGVPFPFSCRVGGCATCKCRVTSGRVRELTDAAYLLSDEELAQGCVLACQSVPQTDVEIEVDLSAARAARSVAGRVVGQRRLTHDITALDVQLEQGLPYRAGQHASLSVGTMPGVSRTYSFAAPVRADSRVTFFVRKVPRGAFSSHVNDADLTDQPVQVEGPLGDFWLRPSPAPLLLVAGGSGLAPILAMLQEAAEANERASADASSAAAADAGAARSVTLLFGARTQRDLFALEEIAAIGARWRGAFRFVPVLSDASDDSTWHGERGLVADRIADYLEPGSDVYLCGPPVMVDSAETQLTRLGVPRERTFADRFLTAPPAATLASNAAALTPPSRIEATWFDYVKFLIFYGVGLCVAASMIAGGNAITIGLIAVVLFYVVGDAVLGVDVTTPRYRHARAMTVMLWGALPLLALIIFAAVWGVSPGDPLGFGEWVRGITGHDMLAAKAASGPIHVVSAVLLSGLMIGLIGTITAHELIHRTWDKASMLIGRWLLAFSFDTTFAIEHVYGHHRYVSTQADPATAPRGRNVYAHIVVSTIKGNVSAWEIERRRLKSKGRAMLSSHNAVLRGCAMSALLVAGAFAMGGWRAALFFVACALWGKALLEVVNYMEHYGLVRPASTPVQPRHSWNSNHRISSWSSFNLTRHSHHHAQGELPYQELKPIPDAPMMIQGYLTTILIALVPPLWHRLMTPKLLDWDQRWADGEERLLAAQANARSGIARLEAAARPPRVPAAA